MAINYSAPRIAARNIVAPASSVNINQALGLRSSPYEGLQQVGGQNLYYGKGGLYESYSPEPVRFYRNSPYFGGTQYYSNPYASYGIGSSAPSLVNFGGMSYYSGGWQKTGGDVEGTIRIGDQAFRPSTNIPAGFIEVDGKYEPSMAYIYSKSVPNIKAQPNRMFTNVAGYTPASGSLLSNAPVGNSYGAGQYLSSGSGLLGGGFNFGTPSGRTAG